MLGHVREQSRDATERAFGRARADFHARLVETQRTLSERLTRAADDPVRRVLAAVAAGDTLAALATTERQAATAQRQALANALRPLISRLDETAKNHHTPTSDALPIEAGRR